MLKDSFNHMRKQGSKTEMVTQSPDSLRCCPPPDEQLRIERAIELAGERYDQVVASACAGEDGPDTWRWDTGIAP
nr:hypothetical protein [Salmonella enterica]